MIPKKQADHLAPPFGYELGQLTEFAAIRRDIEGPETLESEEIAATLLSVSSAVDWCQETVKAALAASQP